MRLVHKFAVNSSVVCAELDNEAVLLNIENGMYYGLDSVGMDIWKLLEQGTSEDEIVTHMLDEYEVEAEQLHADVVAFLDTLRTSGLVRAIEDAG